MGLIEETGPRLIDAALNLLDRQIVDKDGKMAGNIDDLELTEDPNGAPYVTAILAGPGALARQLGGKIGHWMESVHRRLHEDEQPGPPRISFGVVRKIDNHVEVIVSREELAISRFEDWTRDHIIGRIPGAHREAGE
jgi:hypothetical protein